MLWNRNNYCGSGSDFGKVSFPVPDLSQEPGPDHRMYLAQFFITKNLFKILLFSYDKQHRSPESCHFILIFDFCTYRYVFHNMLDLDPNPKLEQECIPVPVPLRQKVAIPVPQHTALKEQSLAKTNRL